MRLREHRLYRSVGQEVVAKTLGIGQAAVSKIERRDDLQLSTLRRYLSAIGGRLRLSVEYRDATIPLEIEAEETPFPAPSEDSTLARTVEAFSRVHIDEHLKSAGWDLLGGAQVKLELNTGTGRADYILYGKHGPLAVLEAKRPDLDPYDAREQARGYAENVNAPFVILSNGKDHYFWSYRQPNAKDAYRIETLPSPEDLERQRLRNLHPPRPLRTIGVERNYLAAHGTGRLLRGYQLDAVNAVADLFDHKNQRKFLLEMATGTGKTLVAAAIIRRFLESRNAERVLFIVDRIELARQAMETFKAVLHEFKPVIYRTARHDGGLLGSSVVVATLQSLMVDRRYREDFTPFYFDLVINDEAHRSIYGDARELVQFFQATRIGLTATPKAYLKNVDLDALQRDDPRSLDVRRMRDTYVYFDCAPGYPSYRYDLLEAVRDPEGPFLCLPRIVDVRSDITTQALSEAGWQVTIDEQEETFKISDLERKIFTPERNRLMCDAFLEHAQRSPDGQIGQSIIFSVNQAHATALTKILNDIAPGSALTITSRVPEAPTLAKEFRDGRRPERIAVSVDMLSTGYDCPQLLNVGLMRPIFSPSEYLQIKGRGTRRHTFRVGNTEYDKTSFSLLDFCAVAEYFEDKYDYSMPLPLPRVQRARSSGSRHLDATGTDSGETVDGPSGGAISGQTWPVPIWTGRDIVISHDVRIVGPNGEKVDALTFRGSFERDLTKFAERDHDFEKAVSEEDDAVVEQLLSERFFNRPEMYYSPKKLTRSYGVPATAAAFAYEALGKRRLPDRETLIEDVVEGIAARFNLRFNESRFLTALARLLFEDSDTLQRFLAGDMTVFLKPQFAPLGGLRLLTQMNNREDVLESLRNSNTIQQLLAGMKETE